MTSPRTLFNDRPLLQAGDLLFGVAELAQERAGVLPQRRRTGALRCRRLRKTDRMTRRAIGAELWVFELPHHVERLDLRVLVQVRSIAPRTARNARRFELRQPLGVRLLE